jgi:hypothetical protein
MVDGSNGYPDVSDVYQSEQKRRRRIGDRQPGT